jgi:hypothetical protein
MAGNLEWKEIVRELERAVRAEAIPAVILDLAARWERDARGRVTKALVDGMGARWRYDTDPQFHRTIDAIAQIATYAVFDEPLVTDDERKARRLDFDTVALGRAWIAEFALDQGWDRADGSPPQSGDVLVQRAGRTVYEPPPTPLDTPAYRSYYLDPTDSASGC